MQRYFKKIFYSVIVFSVVAAFMAGFAFGFSDSGEHYATVNISEK